VTDALPDDVDSPKISKADADTDQIVWIAVQSKLRDGLELTDIVDRLYARSDYRLWTAYRVSSSAVNADMPCAFGLDRGALAARRIDCHRHRTMHCAVKISNCPPAALNH
jgi:hypothetical protein